MTTRKPPPETKPRFRWRRWLLGLLALLLLVLILLSFSSYEVETVIEIKAAPREVWAVLTDFPGYAAWHPYLKEVSGSPEPDQPLTLKYHFQGQPPRVVQGRVETAMPEMELRWHASWMLVRILDAEEYYLLDTAGLSPGTVRVRHGVRCTGLAVPFLRKQMDRFLRQGLQEMNEALRDRAQAQRRR